MVGSRWESSKRPLFVRTIWKDGHHHVVLRADEEVSQIARSPRRTISSSSSRRTVQKSATTRDNTLNFKVPSVKLLLAGLRQGDHQPRLKRFKNERGEFAKSAVTVEVIPKDYVRFSNINQQVAFKNEKIIMKTRSVEVARDVKSPPPFSYDDFWSGCDNTLSDRVMMWLDLAVQNQQLKNRELKKRVVTACPQAKETSAVCGTGEDEERQELPSVMAPMECDHVDEVTTNLNVTLSTMKRQLHIFMPSLPKKSTSESSSYLSSSKTSSSVNKCV